MKTAFTLAFFLPLLLGSLPALPTPNDAGGTRDCHSYANDKGYGGYCTLSGYWWHCKYTDTGGSACQDSNGTTW